LCDLLSRLFAVTERDRIEQGALVRQRQSDGSVLNAGRLAQRRQAVSQQLSKGGRIVIADVVERCLGRDHAGGIETWRDRLKTDERSNEQPGRRQQHDCQGHFSGDQRLAQPKAATACDTAAGGRGPQLAMPGEEDRQDTGQDVGQQRQ